MSFDSPAVNQGWAEDEGFGFELWTDGPERTLALTYGAARTASQGVPFRRTVLLGADGELLLEYEVSNIGTHPGQVLEDCEQLFGP